MRSTTHVVTPAAFETWMNEQKAPAQPSAPAAGSASGNTPAAAVDAKKLFTDGNGSATACGACHKLADAATTGETGPDLDKVLKGKAAAFIEESIVMPDKEIAAGFQAGIMPKNYGDTLSPEELRLS